MKNKGSGELNGFVDSGASFKGELEFEDTMRIDGRFNGKIVSKNELIVGESATIEGDIHVGRIAISGRSSGKSRQINAWRSIARERCTATSRRHRW